MNLSERHLKMLRDESAIASEIINARGYRTITDKQDLEKLGFSKSQQLTPGLLLPVKGTDGNNGLNQFRPDRPRTTENKKTGKVTTIKYETPFDAAMRLDCPPVCRAQLADPSIPLWLTEGIKKGDALASAGYCAVAMLGVWNFKGKNDFSGVTFLADFDFIAVNGRDVRIVFDSDVMQKPEVRKAMERLTEHLERKGAVVKAVYLPNEGNGKTGVDDFLAKHSPAELEQLVSEPKPEANAKAPIIEFLDAPPNALRRPLQVIENHAYAAAWLYVKKTVSESLDENGNIVKHNPPKEETRHELFVLRDDGKIYGYGQNLSLDDLGFEVILPEPIPENRAFSTNAVKNYLSGKRVEMIDVFEKLVKLIDRFLDFDRSLADQKTMCELVACYTMATWFTESFNVAGYVWATGEKGSGKSHLLSLICTLAYLGQFIQASGSLASLRDLADYGAFLGFDDAEQVTHPKYDPDKRNLLLAGNRRGSQITVKEPIPNERAWRTRYVNTFCPRGFTATRSPDPILGSRAITIPLVCTADKSKGDADPSDESLWEFSPKNLRDEMWQVTLANLVKTKEIDKRASYKAALTGRNLEPWRNVLAIADFMDVADVNGRLQREYQLENETSAKTSYSLFERMNALSIAYQKDRLNLESGNLTWLVLRSILLCIVPNVGEQVSSEQLRAGKEWILQTKVITEKAREVIETDDLDFDPERINGRVIGRSIGKLRFEQARGAAPERTKGWRIKAGEFEKLLRTFNLLKPDPTYETSTTSMSSTTSINSENSIPENQATDENQGDFEEKTFAMDDMDDMDVVDVKKTTNAEKLFDVMPKSERVREFEKPRPETWACSNPKCKRQIPSDAEDCPFCNESQVNIF